MPHWFPAVASSVLALIPVIIWLRLIHREGEEKSLYIKTFLLGTLSIIPPFILILFFDKYPELNIYSAINRTVKEVALVFLLTNVVVGIIEEIAKNIIVRILDKRHPEYIQTISSALKLSICAGLGFSFAENIFYFYHIWTNPQFGFSDFFSIFVFRSIFTMCAHMVFSGIFGYYFGLGKFSLDLNQYARLEGKSMRTVRFLSRLTGEMPFEVLRELKNMQGLFIAMTLHALFNASLDLEYKFPAILLVVLGALYIVHLMQTKSGHLLFSVAKRRASSMAPTDEDVVLELIGMWTREGKLKEVMDICNRLLLRDPDNNVVKLFRAKAADNQELKNFYNSLKKFFEKEKNLPGKTIDEPMPIGSCSCLDVHQHALSMNDEKTVLEVMHMWYKNEDYKKVLEVANRLLERNPKSEGAKVLLEKAMDKEKMRVVLDSLVELFKE